MYEIKLAITVFSNQNGESIIGIVILRLLYE